METVAFARAFWIIEPGRGEIRDEPLASPGPGELLVRTEFSGISRGTESIVFGGHVPLSEHARMRAPFQSGEFPAPVKYGYCSVGVVEGGDPAWARPSRLRPLSAPDEIRDPGDGGTTAA